MPVAAVKEARRVPASRMLRKPRTNRNHRRNEVNLTRLLRPSNILCPGLDGYRLPSLGCRSFVASVKSSLEKLYFFFSHADRGVRQRRCDAQRDDVDEKRSSPVKHERFTG